MKASPKPIRTADKRPRWRHLFPHRGNLHPNLRLIVGGLFNLVLVIWVRPHLGAATDPAYALANALRPLVAVALPSVTLLVLLPVFFLGREVPRLLAIGFSFLPAYVLAVGLMMALSLLLN
ncbi:MAG: hypothetical protein M9920_05090 [Verrucomicrobiae bacterium]|nr:hypothetical protein [Verrucomicrobiae bacterium]